MTEDWRVEFKIEEPHVSEPPKIEELPTPLTIEALPPNVEEPKATSQPSVAEEPEIAIAPEVVLEDTEHAEPPPPVVVESPKIMEEFQIPSVPTQVAEKSKIIEEPQAQIESAQVIQEPKAAKPIRTRRTKKTVAKKKTKNENVDG